MELYYVLSFLDRDKQNLQEKIYKSLGLPVSMTMLGKGTATREHLSMHGLTRTEKAVISTVADRQSLKQLMRATKEKLYIDIPGNGLMAAIPIKSVGGAQTLAMLTNNQPANSDKPAMKFDYELIYVIYNEGHSDEVMDAARPAGATGGTVISAKGTGLVSTEKFRGLSLASEREIILIVARSSAKANIMRAIITETGPSTPAGAICFSLPISQIAGIRRLDEEDEEGKEQAQAPAEGKPEEKPEEPAAEH